MKAEPLVPVAVDTLVIEGGVGRMVMTREAVPVPPALLALIPMVVVPVAVGVPVMAPVLVLTLRPVGNPVAVKPVGLLEAVIR